jgi:hypothetical protein
MKLLKFAGLLSLGIALSACGTSDVVTRDAPLSNQSSPAPLAFAAQPDTQRNLRITSTADQGALTQMPQAMMRQITVSAINVVVPTDLRVSEANRYYPSGDIVWREDPMGNRHAQVAKIVHDALSRGTTSFTGPAAVMLDVEVERFHALSEKARYTVGGVHNIIFSMVLRDATTGAPLSEARRIEIDLEAFGGQQAITAETRGLTQKVRITGHMAEVIRQELSRPEGYKNASAGFFQLINNI